MDIIVGYGVGPWTERILRYYWDHLSMVTRTGSYYSTLFKGHRGVTKGDTISPTIFNMVVDSVICHWVTLVAGEEAGPDGFGQAFQWMAVLFMPMMALSICPCRTGSRRLWMSCRGCFTGWASRPTPKKPLGWCVNYVIFLSDIWRWHIING